MSLSARVEALARALGSDFKALFQGKVDKVEGQRLSSNDFTGLEKLQLANMPDAISAAVISALRQFRGDGAAVTTATATLDKAFAGKWVSLTYAGAVVTMPSADTLLSGQTIRLLNRSSGQITLLAQGTQGIVVNKVSYSSVTLEAGQVFELACNRGNTAWYVVDQGWLDIDSLLPSLSGLGGQNLFYNTAMRLASVADIADGWRLDGPSGSVGDSTGVMTLVPSFMNPDENAQRIVVTKLNNSSLYRSLTGEPSQPLARVAEGMSVTASINMKGTAGLGLRIFIQAIDSAGGVISVINGLVNVLNGGVQRFSLAYANLPAKTVRVQVFYRLYSSAVDSGTADFARPMLQIGPLSGWVEDTRVKANVGDALTQMRSFGLGADVAPYVKDYNTPTVGGIYRASAADSANIPPNSNTTVLFNGRYSQTGGYQLVGELAPSKAGTRLFARGQYGGTYYDYREVAFTDNPTFVGPVTIKTGPLTISSDTLPVISTLNSPGGKYKILRFASNNQPRWDVGGTDGAESGSNAGTDFYINRFADDGTFLDSPFGINRATGVVRMGSATVSGAFRLGQFTLATRPSAAASSGCEIDVTDTPGGPQRQRSNGTAWLVLNVGGWTNLTLNSGATASTNHPPQYRMVGDSVELRGKFTLTAALDANTAFTIATLATGFRPAGLANDSEVVRMPVCSASQLAANVQAIANRVGSLAVVSGTALTANAVIDLSAARFSTTA